MQLGARASSLRRLTEPRSDSTIVAIGIGRRGVDKDNALTSAAFLAQSREGALRESSARSGPLGVRAAPRPISFAMPQLPQ